MKSILTDYGILYAPDDELVAGRILDANGCYPVKELEIRFMRDHITEGMLCVDVGANCGMSSLPMAHYAGQEGMILAYEPTPELQPALRQTLRGAYGRGGAYGFALPFAAGNESGERRILANPLGSGGNRIENTAGGNRVLQITLDEHIHAHERPVGFLKIDAEGMDIDVLRGAVDILENDRPVVMYELNRDAMLALGKNPHDESAWLQTWINSGKYEQVHISFDDQNWGLVPR